MSILCDTHVSLLSAVGAEEAASGVGEKQRSTRCSCACDTNGRQRGALLERMTHTCKHGRVGPIVAPRHNPWVNDNFAGVHALWSDRVMQEAKVPRCDAALPSDSWRGAGHAARTAARQPDQHLVEALSLRGASYRETVRALRSRSRQSDAERQRLGRSFSPVQQQTALGRQVRQHVQHTSHPLHGQRLRSTKRGDMRLRPISERACSVDRLVRSHREAVGWSATTQILVLVHAQLPFDAPPYMTQLRALSADVLVTSRRPRSSSRKLEPFAPCFTKSEPCACTRANSPPTPALHFREAKHVNAEWCRLPRPAAFNSRRPPSSVPRANDVCDLERPTTVDNTPTRATAAAARRPILLILGVGRASNV